jgi:hypothetical protein
VTAPLCGSLQTHPGTLDAVGGGHIIRALAFGLSISGPESLLRLTCLPGHAQWENTRDPGARLRVCLAAVSQHSIYTIQHILGLNSRSAAAQQKAPPKRRGKLKHGTLNDKLCTK